MDRRENRIYVLFTGIFLFSIFLIPCKAQEYKREIEKRIKEYEMPESALEILGPFLDKARRIKFYYEQDMAQSSFECKFRYNKTWFSVEFSETGQLEDVEFLISLKDLPERPRDNILDYLKKKYLRYKITRLQKQFSADPDLVRAEKVISSALKNDEEEMTIKYEMELNGNSDGQLISHEILFDHNGELIRDREIIRRQLDNILY